MPVKNTSNTVFMREKDFIVTCVVFVLHVCTILGCCVVFQANPAMKQAMAAVSALFLFSAESCTNPHAAEA